MRYPVAVKDGVVEPLDALILMSLALLATTDEKKFTDEVTKAYARAEKFDIQIELRDVDNPDPVPTPATQAEFEAWIREQMSLVKAEVAAMERGEFSPECLVCEDTNCPLHPSQQKQ